MNRKILGIAMIVLGAVFIAGFGYFLFLSDTPLGSIFSRIFGDDNPAQPAAEAPVTEAPTTPRRVITAPAGGAAQPGGSVQPPSPERMAKEDLMRLAASFAERFGSYSNQSDFSNVTDVKILMSANMKIWAEGYVSEQRLRKTPNDLYFGITTKAVAEEVKAFDDHLGKAMVLVATRRREASGTTSNYSDVYSQEVEISFVRENGAWKVDAATWLDK